MVPSLTAVDDAGHAAHARPPLRRRARRTGRGVAGGADDASGGFLGYVRWLRERGARRPTASGPRSRWPTTRWRARRCSTRRPRRSRTRCSTSSGGTPRWPASSGITRRRSCRASCRPGGRRARSTATVPRSRRGASTPWPSSSSPAPTSRATCSCCSAPRSSCGSSPTRAPRCPGYVTIPHTASGNFLVGGPSNAGGLFRDWATRLLAPAADRPLDPGAVPVWAPYPRGERVPLNDHTRRAVAARPRPHARRRPRSCAPPTRRRRSW